MLFLGNSYTFYNELNLVLSAIYADKGDTVVADRLAEGGYTFADHVLQLETDGSDWQAAFAQSHDWVVLQEQSQIPGFPEDEAYVVESRASARTLDEAARDSGADTLFFMTWGRRDGDETNPDLFPDFPTMQERLTAGYRTYVADAAAEGRTAWIAPVGLAWSAVWDRVREEGGDPADPASDFYGLYNADGSHPSPVGTWLAACVIYSSLEGESAEGATPPPEVADGDTWAALAWETVAADTTDDFPWRTDTGDTGEGDTGADDSGSSTDTDDGTGETGPTTSDTGADAPESKEGGSCACGQTRSLGWGATLLAVLAWRRRR